MKKFVFLFILFLAVAASGQIRTFRYPSVLCDNRGTYNSRKYTEAQLRNTTKLFGEGEYRIKYDATVWKYEDIAKLSVEALDREFKEKVSEIKSMKIVTGAFWESMRQAKIRELEQVHKLFKTTSQAYLKPEVLLDYDRADSCKLKYARPIAAGGEELFRAWREVNLASQKANVDPGRLQRRFDQENSSPDRLRFALVETMMFGWWNCANALIQRNEKASDGTAEEAFEKLFIKLKRDCDEP